MRRSVLCRFKVSSSLSEHLYTINSKSQHIQLSFLSSETGETVLKRELAGVLAPTASEALARLPPDVFRGLGVAERRLRAVAREIFSGRT